MSNMTHTPEEIEAERVHAAHEDAENGGTAAATARKPRLAIMGEFSAGKSTLSNLLLGARPLPERVTATRLSPVWITYGDDGAMPVAVGVDGTEEEVDLEDIAEVDVEITRFIHMTFDSPILEECDLIDFPGISDPNMDSEVWERMLGEVDLVLWCTHATQAWRQSEAAAWELVPEAVRARSLLLVTRFDKLTTERDRARVLNRLTAETEGLFAGMYPLSLLQALEAADTGDAEAWSESGAERFATDLRELLSAVGSAAVTQMGAMPEARVQTAREMPASDMPPSAKIVPRRIRSEGAAQRPRPAA